MVYMCYGGLVIMQLYKNLSVLMVISSNYQCLCSIKFIYIVLMHESF